MPQFFSQFYSIMTGMSPCGPQGAGPVSTWQPPVDVYSCADRILVVVELPGVRKEDLSVDTENGILRIAGIRHKQIPDDTEHVHQMEIPYGQFARYVRLPESARVNEITAALEDGYLRISIPKSTQE